MSRVVTALLCLLAACQTDDGPRGVPPASEWKPPEAVKSRVGGGGERDDEDRAAKRPRSGDPHAGMDGEDPHAGMDMDDPHAGMNPDDPHAGMDMGGGSGGAHGSDPHGTDPQMANMEPPDPDRPIDPKKFLRGKIRASGSASGAVKSGAVLFLSVWPVDKASGEVIGSPLAAAKLEVGTLPMAFDLSERDMMSKGTRFEGDVLLIARVDGDGEARTKEPGDVEGRINARIPAAKLDLVLDTVLR
jgi:hypothetical protein